MIPRPAGRTALRSPVVRASFALILNTGVNGVLGLAYWVVAARVLPSEIVGAGAAAVSALLFVSSLGWAGMQFVLIRYVPVAGRHTGRLVVGVYAIATLVAVTVCLGFLVVVADSPDLGFIVDSPVAATAFAGAVAVWVVFSLQDAVLIGIGRTGWVPVENAIFGAAKLGLLLLLAPLSSPWVLLVSWILAAAALAVVVNSIIALRTRRHGGGTLPGPRQLARFAGEQHVISLLIAAPDSLVPLLIVATLGPTANAHYYAAWTVSFSLRLIIVNIGSALTAESARSTAARRSADRHAGWLTAALVIPIVIGTLAVAPLVMQLYGDEYVAGTNVLRLFALGIGPFSVVALYIARERVAERGGRAAMVALLGTGLTLAIDVIAIPLLGIVGAGLGWLIGWGVAALVVVTTRRWGRGEPVHGHNV